jgi:hypothetical protein
MTIAEKKLELISWLSNLHDEGILDQLESVRKKAALEKYQRSLSPMSIEEFKKGLSEAEEDIKAGRVISQEELKKRIRAGKIL